MARGAAIDILDGLSSSTAIKGPVALKTTGNVTLAGEQTIDGTLTAESRVLVGSQTDPTENGLYVTSSGDWRRCADFSRNNDVVNGTLVVVTGGATGVGIWSTVIAGAMRFDTTSIAFSDVATISGAVTLGALTTILADYATTAAVAAALASYATLAGPDLTGNPTAPTPAAGDSDTSIANTAWVQAEILRTKRRAEFFLYGEFGAF